VSYEVRGPLRDILVCHCEECRRWSGYVGAFSATAASDLVFREERGLRWAESPKSDRGARRGFCGECGSSLFWAPAGSDRINIAVGTLDRPTGLRIGGHWYAHHSGDYDELPDDAPVLTSAEDAGRMRWS
jgi:hypothetical protein